MITSTANKKIKELAGLSAKAKARDAADVFLAEGPKLFMEAPDDRIRAVYIEESCFRNADRDMKAKLKGHEYEVVSSGVFGRISDTKTPQGVLTVLRQYHYKLHTLLKCTGGQKPLLLILEDIQDPGNLGAMLRTAEGAGVSGVIMTGNTVDIYNPKTIRSTMGSIYRMPFFVADDLKETLASVKEAGIRVYAAHLEKGTCAYDGPDYTGGSAFLIGNEGKGLTEGTAAFADRFIHIPMQGQVESLNAAMAAGILMYEASRQRSRGKEAAAEKPRQRSRGREATAKKPRQRSHGRSRVKETSAEARAYEPQGGSKQE